MPKGPASRAASWAAAAALLIAGPLIVVLPGAPTRMPNVDGPYFSSHVDVGLALMRRIKPTVSLSYNMPLASLLPALVYHPRGSRTARAWMAGLIAVWAARSLALAGLLASWSAAMTMATALPALALWIGFSVADWTEGSYRFVDFEQFGYSIFVLLVAGALAWRAKAPSPLRSALAAAVIGVSLLYRCVLVLFPPFLAAAEFAFARREKVVLSKYWKDAAILCTVPYLFLAPWTWMNWVVHGRFIPFEDGKVRENLVTGALGYTHALTWEIRDAATRAPAEGASVIGWYLRQAGNHPWGFLSACAARAAYAVSCHPSYPPLFALALFALWLRRDRGEYRVCGWLVLYFVAIHSAGGVQQRYFLPLWPILAAVAATLPMALWERGSPRREPPAVFAGLVLGAAVLALGAFLFTAWTTLDYARRAAAWPQSALGALDDIVAANPADAWLLGQRGKQRLRTGDLRGAIDDLSRADGMDGDEKPSPERAWALALQGEPALLLETRWETMDFDETRFMPSVMRAVALQRLGRPERAAAEMDAAWEVWEFWHRADVARLARETRPAELEKMFASLSVAFGRNIHSKLLGRLTPPEHRPAVERALSALLSRPRPFRLGASGSR